MGLLSGCRSNTPSDADTGKSLIVYSGRSEKLISPLIEQFSKVSGIEVSVKYAKSSQLAATLLEESKASPADIFIAQDPGALGVVEDMFRIIPHDTLNKVPEWARSPEDKWIGISGRARVVVYNSERLTQADLPADIWDFIYPEWEGRIGFPPTNASFQTMVTSMRHLWGEGKTRRWIEGILANNPRTYSNNTATVEAVANGEIDIGFVNHYYLHRLSSEKSGSFSARNYHPRAGGPAALVMVAGAGILSSSSNQDAAEQFLAFMVSLVAQQYFASQTFEYPVIDGVDIDPLLKPLSQIAAPSIALKDLADLEGTQAILREAGVLP